MIFGMPAHAQGKKMEEEIMAQQGLASLLKMSSGTVAKLVSVDPKRLPPFTNMGTVRRVIPRWRKTAVLAWLAEREVLPPLLVRMEPVILAPQKKRGRPRKVAS